MDEDEARRKRAFSIKIDLNPPDRIVEIVARRDGIYAISLNKIVRINTPDDIDSATHDTTLVTQTTILEKGSRNSVVARTILQAKDFANWIASEDQRQRVQDIAWEVMFCLLSFDKFLAWYQFEIDEKQEAISAASDKYLAGPSPAAMPIIENLETEFRATIFIAKHALNAISELFNILFGANFKRGHYYKIAKWSEEKFGADDHLSRMLQNDQKWIQVWIEVRNALEHPKADYYVKVNNFRLLPNREPQLPTWQLKHPELDHFRPQNMGTAMENYRNNILGFFENLLFVLTDKAINLPVYVGIEDRDERDRDPDCPKRYLFTSIAVKPKTPPV